MNKTIYYAFFLLFGVFISSLAQVFLKKAALKTYDSKIKEYLNPTVIFSYIVFFGATLLTIIAYKGIPISMGPILESTSYFYVTFWGVKIFKEKITIRKIIALGLIVIGIAVYAIWG